MILNINQLRTFVTAARLKSVTVAAQELMVTVPAISMQIRRLEQVLGFNLMYRHRNAVELTEAGKSLFLESSYIFEEIKNLERFIGTLAKDTSGALRIACPPTPTKYIMPKLTKAFKKIYPDVRLALTQTSSSQVLEGVKRETYDLGLTYCTRALRGVKVVPVASDDLVLVSSPRTAIVGTSAISAAMLSTIPLIMPGEGSVLCELVLTYLRKFNVNPRIVVEGTGVDLIKELVKDDQGVSFVVGSAVKDELQNGVLRSISIAEGWPVIEYGIVYRQRKYLSPAAWAFVRLAEEGGGHQT